MSQLIDIIFSVFSKPGRSISSVSLLQEKGTPGTQQNNGQQITSLRDRNFANNKALVKGT